MAALTAAAAFSATLRGAQPAPAFSPPALRALEAQLRALRAEHEALRRCLDQAGVVAALDFDKELAAVKADSARCGDAKSEVPRFRAESPTLARAVSRFKAPLAQPRGHAESRIPSPTASRSRRAGCPTSPAPASGIPSPRAGSRTAALGQRGAAAQAAPRPQRHSLPGAGDPPRAAAAAASAVTTPTVAAARGAPTTELEAHGGATLERQFEIWDSKPADDSRVSGVWEPWESEPESESGHRRESDHESDLESAVNSRCDKAEGAVDTKVDEQPADTTGVAPQAVKSMGKGKGKKGPPPPPKSSGPPKKEKARPEADEGALVQVQAGMHAGKRATVLKVSGEGKEMRWRVQIEDGPATWVDAVSLVDAAAGQSALPSSADQQQHQSQEAPSSSPADAEEGGPAAILSGRIGGSAVPGKGKGKKGPPPPPKSSGPPKKEKARPEADDGALVQVQAGMHAGKRATVLKVSGEGKEMRWRVQIEDGPATWVDAVSLVDAAAGQAALPSSADQQRHQSQEAPSSSPADAEEGGPAAILSGRIGGSAVPGKGKGKKGPPPPPKSSGPPKKEKARPEADEGALVQVQAGMHAGKRATVLKVSGEGKEMRWRVQIEDGPATWVDAVSLVDAAAGQSALPSSADQQQHQSQEAPSSSPADAEEGGLAAFLSCEVGVEATHEAAAAEAEAAELERLAREEAEAAEALPPLPEGWIEMKEVRLPTGRVPPGTSGAEPVEVICIEEMITAAAEEVATEDKDVRQQGGTADHQRREPGQEPLRRRRGPAGAEHGDTDDQLDQHHDSALAAPAGAGAEAGTAWDCPGCGLQNEGGAGRCVLCSAEREAPAAADADGGEGQGVGAVYEVTPGDDELQDQHDLVDEDVGAVHQPRFSVIDEDEVKYFQDGAKEAFAVPLPAFELDDEDCLDSSNEMDPEDDKQCLADEFDDGECF